MVLYSLFTGLLVGKVSAKGVGAILKIRVMTDGLRNLCTGNRETILSTSMRRVI